MASRLWKWPGGAFWVWPFGKHDSVDPIEIEQSFGVQITAAEFLPIVIEQSFGVEIDAVEAPTGFDPESLDDQLVWFDISDTGSWTDAGSGNISSWTNKFTGVAYTEATNRPTHNATHMGGLPAAVADGVADQLATASDPIPEAGLADAKDYYLVAVVQADDLDAIEVFFSVGRSDLAGNGSKRWGINTTGAGKWSAVGTPDVGSGIAADSTENTTADPTIVEFRCVAGVTSVRVNGGAWTAGTATAYGTLTPDQSGLFHRASSSPATRWDGAMSELLAYGPAVATDTDAQDAVLAYLNAKWSIF